MARGLVYVMAVATMSACLFTSRVHADVPARAYVEQTVFDRVGCGMRKILWKKVYTLCLYAGPSPASLLRMDIVYKGDMPEGMPDDWRPHLRRVISEDKFKVIDGFFGQLNTGDIVQFAFLPTTEESTMLINDKPAVTAPGMALYKSVQAMWFGDKPISNRLKDSILNRNCEFCN